MAFVALGCGARHEDAAPSPSASATQPPSRASSLAFASSGPNQAPSSAASTDSDPHPWAKKPSVQRSRLEEAGWTWMSDGAGKMSSWSVFRRRGLFLTVKSYEGPGVERLSTMPELREARLMGLEYQMVAILVPGHPDVRDEVFKLLFPGATGWLGSEERPF